MRTSTAVILTEFGKPFVLLIATLELAERVYKIFLLDSKYSVQMFFVLFRFVFRLHGLSHLCNFYQFYQFLISIYQFFDISISFCLNV